MRLKIRGTLLTCKVANKCLNICEGDKVVERIKTRSPPFLYCPENCQCLQNFLIEKIEKRQPMKTCISKPTQKYVYPKN